MGSGENSGILEKQGTPNLKKRINSHMGGNKRNPGKGG